MFVKEGSTKGYDIPGLEAKPEEFAPGIGPDEYVAIAKRLMANM